MVQKLDRRNTYTPTSTPQARGNCDPVIKHGQASKSEPDQVLQGLKTLSNNSDVDQLSGKRGQNLRVPVLNMRNVPLMPTTPGKARHLLEQGNAEVVKRKPFVIQLKYATGETTQPIALGIDSGFKHVGFSAVTDTAELMAGVLDMRTDIPQKLLERKMYRRNRRNRLWHRPPRFDNRGRTKGWLAPSIQHKLDSHLRLIARVKAILPVSKVAVEVAAFDIQKIKDPTIEGEQYQAGDQAGFWNVREYVLHRDNHTCQHCKGKKNDPVLQVHHINGKAQGATDRPGELLTVCTTCHTEHHTGKDVIPQTATPSFKPETFITTVRWKLVNALGCEHTYGYITKSGRIAQGLDKTHANDAFIIAGGTDQRRQEPVKIVQVRRNNRSVQLNRKGFKPAIRRRRYPLQPHDLVRYDGQELRVKGVHCYGTRVLLENKKSVATSKTELINYGKGLCYV